MGQYYIPLVIADSGDMYTLHSHDFDNGLKLIEHSWIGNNFVNAVVSLINKKPCKVAWIGDYSNEYVGDVYEKLPAEDFAIYYNAAWDEKDRYKLSSKDFNHAETSLIDDSVSGVYLVNHTQHIYLDLGEYIAMNICKSGDWEGYCVNPLPLLTACGNGRGGGDYNYHAKVGIEDVGTWAFDVIEFTDEAPDGYENVMYEFRVWD